MKNKCYINNRVKEYRINNGLTQEGLSYLCGLSQNSISDIEKGKNNVSIFNALKLANALLCSVEDLFYLSDDEIFN